MTIVFYISGHGLGHASRSVALISELLRQRDDARVLVRSNAPAWAFDRIGSDRVSVESCETDTGMAQIDSLRFDLSETARRAGEFHRTFDDRVEEEARRLIEREATMVVADVPPLAVAAARRAGIPGVVVANFTWDWIYGYYPDFEQLAPGVIGTIGDAYAQATLALRLPIAGGFDTMPNVRDIPFIARRSPRDRGDTRRALGLTEESPSVLASFGGYGIDLPYDRVSQSRIAVLAPNAPPPGFFYEDLVAAVDAVVSKPGYGIVSECIANRTPFLFTSRGPFAEYDVMVADMPRLMQCRFIEQDRLLAGDWRRDLDALLAQSAPHRPRVDGAEVAASMILGVT